MKHFGLKTVAILFCLFGSAAAVAGGHVRNDLTNLEVQTTYERGGTIVYRMSGDTLQYTFTAGRMMGAGGVDLHFDSRKIGDEMYLVSWHDETSPNYISVIMDFKNKVEFTTAIMFYGSDMQNTFVTEGKIDKVTKLD